MTPTFTVEPSTLGVGQRTVVADKIRRVSCPVVVTDERVSSKAPKATRTLTLTILPTSRRVGRTTEQHMRADAAVRPRGMRGFIVRTPASRLASAVGPSGGAHEPKRENLLLDSTKTSQLVHLHGGNGNATKWLEGSRGVELEVNWHEDLIRILEEGHCRKALERVQQSLRAIMQMDRQSLQKKLKLGVPTDKRTPADKSLERPIIISKKPRAAYRWSRARVVYTRD